MGNLLDHHFLGLEGLRGRIVAGAFGLAVAAYAGYLGLLAGNPMADRIASGGVQNVLLVVAVVVCWVGSRRPGAQRAVWELVTAALALWTVAMVLWTIVLPAVPQVSIADAFWLAAFPLLLGALVICARQQASHFYCSPWLVGLTVALGMGVIAGVLWPVLRQAASPSSSPDPWAGVVNLAYPLGDVVMLGLLAGVAALVRGRLGRPLAFLALGMGMVALSQIARMFQTLYEGPTPVTITDAVFVGSAALLALGAWQKPRNQEVPLDGWWVFLVPGLFTIAEVSLVASLGLRAPASLGLVLARPLLVLVALASFAAGAAAAHLAQLDARVQARTDELTGLVNRRGFGLAVDERLQVAGSDGRSLVMLLLDLNGFKELNDTCGHHVGDALLRDLAARLTGALPDAIVGRLGGDEFVALLEGEGDPLGAGQRMLAALDDPFPVDGMVTHVGGSVGAARFPQDATTQAELLRAADVAMYRAKRRTTGVELYRLRSDHHSRDRVALAGELHAALESDQLVLYFQPKAALATGEIIGLEALVRWQHPQRGLVYPDAFIELAEQHGLMRRLTLRVLALALRQQRAWAQAGTYLPVAVNISPGNLLDDRFVDDVAALVERWQPPTGALQLEITENTVMLDPKRTLDMLAGLSKLGLTFALDDFGTGYSSLSQLKRLPLAEVKIDKSFVLDMTDNPHDAAIVRSTIQLARNLDLHVVAEGVETQHHWNALATLGCHTAQGYLLSRPLPANHITTWLRKRTSDTEISVTHQSRNLATVL